MIGAVGAAAARSAPPPPAHAGRRAAAQPAARLPGDGFAGLIRAAAEGDERAWAALVARLDGGMRRVAAGYRLAPADVDDVVQAAWVQLFEGIEGVREPAAIAGWLATVTRRSAMRVLQSRMREELSDDMQLGAAPDAERPEQRLLAAERRAALGRAIAGLPERHCRLMRVLLIDADLGYDAISELLAMPIGSIGPIRGRCLDRLRRDAGLQALLAPDLPVRRPA